jgi:hypothetical protein
MDGSISPWGNWILLAWIAGAGIYALMRFGIVLKREHLRDPDAVPFMAPWHILSPDKWTPEGVAFNRRFLAFLVKTVAGLGALWLLLDLFTS